MTKEQLLATIEIDKEAFYSVQQFAVLTNRTAQTVKYLAYKGNRVRKLKSKKIGASLWIYASELTEFPFTYTGTGDVNDKIYHYNEKGEVVNE